MPPYQNFRYFILFVECYSLKQFSYPISNNNSETAADCLKKLLESQNGNLVITEIQSDYGSEYIGRPFKDEMAKHGIIYSRRIGKNGANFAESAIGKNV